ncbi:MAG: hypothetical protein H6Q15_1143 [Bacteroidetes bacterium]|nr:hypothetical protein [Bacteroidota bacterium]
MVVDSMDYYDIYNYFRKVETKIIDRRYGWIKKYKNQLLNSQKGEKIFLPHFQYENNLYILPYGFQSNKHTATFDLIFIFLYKKAWHAFKFVKYINNHTDAQIQNGIIIYIPHLFSRYRQRCKVEKTGVELIIDFLKTEKDTDKASSEYSFRKKKYRYTYTEKGIIICDQYPSIDFKPALCIYKTFVSSELLRRAQERIHSNLKLSSKIMSTLNLNDIENENNTYREIEETVIILEDDDSDPSILKPQNYDIESALNILKKDIEQYLQK